MLRQADVRGEGYFRWPTKMRAAPGDVYAKLSGHSAGLSRSTSGVLRLCSVAISASFRTPKSLTSAALFWHTMTPVAGEVCPKSVMRTEKRAPLRVSATALPYARDSLSSRRTTSSSLRWPLMSFRTIRRWLALTVRSAVFSSMLEIRPPWRSICFWSAS